MGFLQYRLMCRSEIGQKIRTMARLSIYLYVHEGKIAYWPQYRIAPSYYYTYWLKMISNKKELQGNNNDCVILRYATCGGGGGARRCGARNELRDYSAYAEHNGAARLLCHFSVYINHFFHLLFRTFITITWHKSREKKTRLCFVCKQLVVHYTLLQCLTSTYSTA